MKDIRVQFAGRESNAWAALSHLAGAGYRISRVSLEQPLAEWPPGGAPDCIIAGPELSPESVQGMCGHLKLHDEFNRIAVLVLRRQVPPPMPGQCMRLEPDEYLLWPASRDQLTDALDRIIRKTGARNEAGIRFYLEALIPSDPDVLGEVAKVLEPVLWHSGLPESAAERVRYAVLEVGLNAIEWGNRFEPNRGVRFCFSIYADRFTARVADQGAGFDVEAAHQAERAADFKAQMRAREEAGVRFGGYGIRVCRGFVDELHYNETGNEVILTRYLPGKKPESPHC
jgi:anti-sigma regulatory factor (Ser/Thr protein kinase)